MEKNSILIYLDIKETLDELKDEQAGKLFKAIVEYAITGKAPKLTGALRLAFIPIRQQMDRDGEKWETVREKRVNAGQKGGIKSGQKRREKRSNEANEAFASFTPAVENQRTSPDAERSNEANEAVNVNVNVNVNDNVINPPYPLYFASQIITHLNERTGSSYEVDEETVARIGELTSEGYEEDDFRRVIDSKATEWLDEPKMRRYLRPSTLFGPKFREYAGAPEPIEAIEEKRVEAERDELIQERDDLKGEYWAVDTQIRDLELDGYDKHIDEWHQLDTKRFQLERNIENLNKRIAAIGGTA